MKSVGIKDSNEAELLTIRRVLTIGTSFGEVKLVVESDSSNAIKWARGVKRPPWRLITLLREIKELVSGQETSFVHIKRTTNGVADFFAKNGD